MARLGAAGIGACLTGAIFAAAALADSLPPPTEAPPVWSVPATAAQIPNPQPPPIPTVQQSPLEGVRPTPLRRPLETPPAPPQTAPPAEAAGLLHTFVDPPIGFTGPSGVQPSESQQTSDFVPVEDRWRIGFPEWDRYDKGHPLLDDYPYDPGALWNPYKQNVLKGDYPILGQHTFLEITATDESFIEGRRLPTPAHGFESTNRPFEEEFFGRPSQFVFSNNMILSFDLFHGDAGFKPVDWRVKLTPIFNVNFIGTNEVGIVSPNVTKGTKRGRSWFSLEEYFVETKLADISPNYDFVSVRAGSQFFSSDFRGFIFSDTNRAVRIFGTNFSNRDQFNIAYFRPDEKDTNSGLNTFDDRGQNILIANYYRQDFIWPGYTSQWSVHYNHDNGSMHFDKNGFLVRPDPVGIFQKHEIDAVYLGWTGDGHINRINVDHAFYWVLGSDSNNPLAGTHQDINAQMAAVELSYDRDWARFRASFFWASGDENVNNKHATGFDTIFDDPNFAGGQFSFWQREAIKLFGVNLVNAGSLVPDLRSSKIEGQSNFVNPGLYLVNFGVDFDLTPKLKMINNVNLLWFDSTDSLQQFTFQGKIHHFIGVDPSTGFEYRPLLSNNIIVTLGLSALLPGQGFRDIYDPLQGDVGALFAAFLDVKLTF